MKPELRRPKEVQMDGYMRVFKFRHKGASPETIQVVRAVIYQNIESVLRCIEKGSVDMIELEELSFEPELEHTFAEMYDALKHGNEEKFEPLFNTISDTPGPYCAWLFYYNEMLINSFGLNDSMGQEENGV